MTLRFASLGSGSKGNGTLVSTGGTTILLDCGFSMQETERRLARLAVEPDEVDAILVTHEHRDHIEGVARFARRHRKPVWLTHGTLAAWSDASGVGDVRPISPHEPFRIGALEVQPYPVPHDAREPCQFVFTDGSRRLGVLSDVGSVTAHMRAVLKECDGLMIEANHDSAMLAGGPYSPSLKRRVGGDFGHLSNVQAAELLQSVVCHRLRHLVLNHLSEVNNRPELARAAVVQALQCAPDWPAVAEQDRGFGWLTLD